MRQFPMRTQTEVFDELGVRKRRLNRTTFCFIVAKNKETGLRSEMYCVALNMAIIHRSVSSIERSRC